MTDENLLEIDNLDVWFPIRTGGFNRPNGHVKAVSKVSLSVKKGEILGVVGESGSGKTTLGRAILRLVEATSGSIRFEGTELTSLSESKMRNYRRRLQIVFQDPFSSLNPRMRAGDIIGEALDIHSLVKTKVQRTNRVTELLNIVGLSANAAYRFPHEFSGGQKQRIGIARALAVKPDFIVADEPVAALDVSIQAQIINLLKELRSRFQLTIMFISHDLSVVNYLADRVAVLYLGRIVELAPTEQLFSNPLHPYTQILLSAVPNIDSKRNVNRVRLQGEMPSPKNPPSGCVFRTRCPHASAECAAEAPPLIEQADRHFKACIKDGLTSSLKPEHGDDAPSL